MVLPSRPQRGSLLTLPIGSLCLNCPTGKKSLVDGKIRVTGRERGGHTASAFDHSGIRGSKPHILVEPESAWSRFADYALLDIPDRTFRDRRGGHSSNGTSKAHTSPRVAGARKS